MTHKCIKAAELVAFRRKSLLCGSVFGSREDCGPDVSLLCMTKKNQEDDIMAIFEGAGVALVTPFKENRDVNYEKLEELVEEQIAFGTDSIIVCGTTGEASTMTHEEHLDVIKYVCQITKKTDPGHCRNRF